MKKLLFLLLLTSCASVKNEEYDYYYFSLTAYTLTHDGIRYGISSSPNHTTIDGLEFTCCCNPEYVNKEYSKNFPDVVLVKKLPKNTGKVIIHY